MTTRSYKSDSQTSRSCAIARNNSSHPVSIVNWIKKPPYASQTSSTGMPKVVDHRQSTTSTSSYQWYLPSHSPTALYHHLCNSVQFREFHLLRILTIPFKHRFDIIWVVTCSTKHSQYLNPHISSIFSVHQLTKAFVYPTELNYFVYIFVRIEAHPSNWTLYSNSFVLIIFHLYNICLITADGVNNRTLLYSIWWFRIDIQFCKVIGNWTTNYHRWWLCRYVKCRNDRR